MDVLGVVERIFSLLTEEYDSNKNLKTEILKFMDKTRPPLDFTYNLDQLLDLLVEMKMINREENGVKFDPTLNIDLIIGICQLYKSAKDAYQASPREEVLPTDINQKIDISSTDHNILSTKNSTVDNAAAVVNPSHSELPSISGNSYASDVKIDDISGMAEDEKKRKKPGKLRKLLGSLCNKKETPESNAKAECLEESSSSHKRKKDPERYYNLDTFSGKGRCLIINNMKFSDSPDRTASIEDCERLQSIFASLGCDVQVYEDLDVQEIRKTLNYYAGADYTDSPYLVVIILSHGAFRRLKAKSGTYSMIEVFKRFTGEKCETLTGKPKLFLINACQGILSDPGATIPGVEEASAAAKPEDKSTKACVVPKVKEVAELEQDQNTKEEDISAESTASEEELLNFLLPSNADFLVGLSSVPGYSSWEHPEEGAWFIDELCTTLENHIRDDDMLSLLVDVNRRLSRRVEAVDPEATPDIPYPYKKQTSMTISTLTKKLKFL